MSEFTEWLHDEVREREWSWRELARRSDLSHSHISQILSEDRTPGLEACIGLANAFGYPPESVLRKAGRLPPEPPKKGRLRRLIWMMNQLSPERQDLLEEYLQFLLEQDETAAQRAAS